jgi:hypothetical protein
MTDDLVERLDMANMTTHKMTLVIVAREAANRIEQLTSGPGGIMEMKQTIANLEEKLDKIASHHIPGVIPDGYTMTEWILKNYTMLKDIARG